MYLMTDYVAFKVIDFIIAIFDIAGFILDLILVKLPTHTPEDILNGDHKQFRNGKGNAAHQQTTNFIYMRTCLKIARRTDRETFDILFI